MQWLRNMQLIDANVILRYLLNDHPEMSHHAKGIIENGAYTKPEVVSEVVYVLKGVYHATREEIRLYIQTMLRSIQCTDSAAIEFAIDLYAKSSLDFVDSLLIAYHSLNGESVFTFDKKMIKFLNSI